MAKNREADRGGSGGNTVLSVRLPHGAAEALQDAAEKRGLSMSVLVREVIEGYLDAGPAEFGSSSSRDLSISSPTGAPVAFYARPGRVGRTTGTEAFDIQGA